MNPRRFRSLAVLAAFVTSAALAWVMQPDRSPSGASFQLEQMVPSAFGDWRVDPSVTPVAPAPDVQANLDKIYDQLLTRAYINSRGERVMLAIAYGGQQTDTLKAHRQEVCYAAQGFAIRAVSPGSLHVAGRNIPVTRVLAVKGARSEPLTYWFTMGDRVVLSRFERLMVQLKFGLAGEIPDGMLVRVSNLSSQADQAYATHAEFANALLGAMRAPDVARLTGAFGA